MCFKEEPVFIWIAEWLFPDFLIPIQRGYYKERNIMVHYPQTCSKNNDGNVLSTLLEHHQLFGCFKGGKRIHAASTLYFSSAFASLNLLQTLVSVCLVSCQPCGWHMLTVQLGWLVIGVWWPVASCYIPDLKPWCEVNASGKVTTEVNVGVDTLEMQCATVATPKPPCGAPATLQMVSFLRPLNNNSAPISPRAGWAGALRC